MEPISLHMIYLIDDDPSVRNALHLLLQTYELPVTCFESPADCLAHLDRSQPGILITDLRMVPSNGLELIRQVRESSRAALPIIVMSGDAEAPDVIDAMHLSVVDFLLKPIDTDRLLKLIREELGM